MEDNTQFDLSTICRMCTSDLMDQECYIIDEQLEDLIYVLTTIKFNHLENKENLRMCVNCYDCLKSFNDFKQNSINIHEKLTQLDMQHLEIDSEEFFVEEITETQDESVDFKVEEYEDVLVESLDQNAGEEEKVFAVEKIVEDKNEDFVQKTVTKRSLTKNLDSSGEKGKEIYKRLLQDCKICGKLIEKNRLEGHVNKHNNVRPYSCPECLKDFYCKQLLRLHRTSIHTNTKVRCDTCDKLFPSARALYAHTLRHRNENRYVCEMCDKKFNNANSLKRHLAIHSGVRDFICTVCGVGFYRKFNLDVHYKNVHQQTKEFKCIYPGCKKCFGYARLLKDHMSKCHRDSIVEPEF